MENPRSLLPILGLTNLGRTLLGELEHGFEPQHNQRRRVLRHETHPIWSPAKETHPTSMRLQYKIISNGLYSPLPIQQRSVMDLSSPLLIGHCESASRLLINLVTVTMQFERINAFNEMCAGLEE
jgi:hypothetical protein